MAIYSSTFVYGGETLYITNVGPSKRPTTTKQQLGKNVVQMNVLGKVTQDWTLNVSGIITGQNVSLSADRAALETLDDADEHALVDGIHDGNFIIVPGTLAFADSGDNAGTHYRYNVTLIQNQ